MIGKLLYLPVWALAVVVNLSAQNSFSAVRHLGQENGLSHDAGNYFISEDSRGFIWISSLNGFYRYDGLELRHFLIPVNNKEGFVPDQTIQSAFFEDAKGNLWFTTYTALHCFNRKYGRIENYRALAGNGEQSDHSYHLFHIEQPDNRLWLRAGDQVWVYDIRSNTWHPQFSTRGIRFSALEDPSGNVRTIIACQWLKGPLVVSRKLPEGGWRSQNFLNEQYEIRSAVPHNDSIAWLTSSKGLIEFNFVSGVISAHYSNAGLNLFAGLSVQEKRYLLLGSQQDGILVFDTKQKKFIQNRRHGEETLHRISTNAPRGFFLSADGQLWVGHKEGGVDFFTLPAFENTPPPFSSIPDISQKTEFIVQDKKQNIWFLTEEGKIYRHSPLNLSLTPFESPTQAPFIHMATDSADKLWAISSHSIYVFQESKGEWEPILSSEMDLVSLFPGVPGRMLVVTRDGIYDLISENGKWTLEPSKEFKDYRGFNFLFLYKLDDGAILIPYQSKDLWATKANGGQLVITDRLKPGGTTYGACRSPFDDSVWFGTNIGLFRYRQGQAEQILKSTGDLGGVPVYGVFVTSPNTVWMSTSRGIRKFQIQPPQLTGIYESDGLPNEQFSEYAFHQSSDGRIWLGNNKGVMVFHPDSITINTPKPKVHIEAFWVNNAPFATAEAISETEILDLNYRENTLSFELRAVNFHHAELNTLTCRLKGYDESFATIRNGGIARFTKVPPGRYSLEVKGINAQGLEGEKKELQIHIRPPFWQTFWFKTASVLAILLIIAAITGAYYRRKLRKQQQLLERQKALNEERNRIAKELHDDMGSSLSSILFLSEDLLTEDSADQQHEIRRISNLAENSMENMREIIWALDTGKNTFQDLAARLRTFATQLLSDNRIGLELDFSTEDADLGGEFRRNIYLIAKEGLHNIVKHANATQVKVSLKLEDRQMVLEIRDNGRGIGNNTAETGSYGLSNMKSRADAIGGTLEIGPAPENGTLLKLRVFL